MVLKKERKEEKKNLMCCDYHADFNISTGVSAVA